QGQADVVENPAVERDAVARVLVGRVGHGVRTPVAAPAAGHALVAGAERVTEHEVRPLADVDHRPQIGAGDGHRLGVVDGALPGQLGDLGDVAGTGDDERLVGLG